MMHRLQENLYVRFLSSSPHDTGNMLAHIKKGQVDKNTAQLSISAPMRARIGMISRRTGAVIKGKESSYDYAKHVNYSRKSPHQFWVEHQIMESVNTMRSNLRHGIYRR